MNPPEAVMCWACYTPLSGGAAASGPAPASGPIVGEVAAKPSIPPWQLGVLGVGLLIALGMGAKTFMGGSGDGDDETPAAITQPEGEQAAAPVPAGVPPVPVPVANPPADVAVPAPNPKPDYSIVSIPNARYNYGTMAIVLADPNATPTQAAAIAAGVRQKMLQNKKWQILFIYVFNDRGAALSFKQLQSTRKGAPLGPNDFRSLSGVWGRAPIRYEYNRGTEGILLPSRSPGNWWTAKTIYTRVRN